MLPAEARPAPAPGGGLVAGSTVVAGELRVREQTEGAAVSRPERGRAPGRPAGRLPGRGMREGHPGLACAVSEDLGETWQPLGALDAGANRDCAYPSVVRLADGRLFCAYYAAPEPAFSGPCDIRGLPLRDRTRS